MENVVFNYSLFIKTIIELGLFTGLYFTYRSKKSKKVKYVLYGALLVIMFVVSNLNFNFAQNTKLDNQRITNQEEMMAEKEKTEKLKVLPNKIEAQDKKTTDYIEKEAKEIHNSIKGY